MSILRDITRELPTTCRKCGACCVRGISGAVPFADDERVPEWYAEKHRASLTARRTVDMPCPWWVPDVESGDERAGECGHYDERPAECRKWERGDQGCREMRGHLIELGFDRAMPDVRPQPRP